jgi:hypothetical protein
MRALDLWLKVLSLFRPSRFTGFDSSLSVSEVIPDPDDLVPDELSIVTAEEFDLAFEEYGLLGPRMTIPIEKRWPAVIPDVECSKYPALKAKCDEIRWTVVRWDYYVQTGRIPDNGNVVSRMIATRYPYLTPRHRSAVSTYASFANR